MKANPKNSFPTKRLRFLTRRDVSDEQYQTLNDAAQVTFLPMENIGEQGKLDCSLSRDIDDIANGYTQFFDGDVLVAKITPCFENGKGALVRGTLNGVGFGTTELHVLRPTREIDARFLYYSTVSACFRQRGEAAMFGSAGQKRVPEEFVRNFRVSLPPLEQQCAIADLLDRKTAQLDALVEAKRRVLELLAEKRQALIATAVTRGLASTEYPVPPEGGSEAARERENRSIESERSDHKSVAGGSWMSGCDENDRRRLKYAATVNDDVLSEDTKHDYELQYIDIGNVYSSGSVEDPEPYQFKDAPSRARRRVRDGDIIISCVRTYLQAIAQIRNPPANLVVSTGFAVVRPSVDFLDPKYASYALREPSFLAEIEKRSVGVSYPAINPSELANISIHLPPLREQRSIAHHLDRETERLDALTAEVENTVALLKERRVALIAEAVIGRIDVECAA